MYRFVIYSLFFASLCSCGGTPVAEPAAEAPPEVISPVTITGISREPLTEYIELNATSGFLQKAVIKASANGYVYMMKAHIGELVASGADLFSIKTKESQSLGNTINLLDSSFKFSGVVSVRSGAPGYITEINHQQGDYVQEGEQLAVINDQRSFAFILNLPYELRPYVIGKKNVELQLPDGQSLPATIASVLPVVDSIAQTQQVVLKVTKDNLPANLIAKVRIVKLMKPAAITLPRTAVLTDETQENFWVMKLTDSTTAVKIAVKKGIETKDKTEIIEPSFSDSDHFILTGNYGLPDTARVAIQQQ
ncbi:MAG: HlyD family efflux transporter periplasmic adaptor subunit [Chitinophagaceae bacterium]